MKYYLHDSNSFSDEKITELYLNFGYEGLGLFYTTLEKLASQEKPIKTNVLKSQLNIGKKLNKCWTFMETLGILSSNNGETFSKQLLNFSEKYQIKKEKNKERIKYWRENQQLTENVTCYEPPCNAPKVKISKVKESKVKESNIIYEAEPLSEYKLCLEFWLKDFHSGWSFNGTQGKALKSIIAKINKIVIDSGKELTNENTLDFFKIVCLKLPDWFKDKDLNVIDSKFNEILTQIKNKQNGTSNTTQSIFRK